jgi:hypothetical protein
VVSARALDPPPANDQVFAMNQRFSTFAEFWPFYLREHSKAGTRILHYIGTSIVLALALAAILMREWWLLAAIPVAGYSFAWIAHFGLEKNRPATFAYPLWSLAADFRMWALWLTGKLRHELDQANAASGSDDSGG